MFVLCINYRRRPYIKFPVPRPGVYKAEGRQSKRIPRFIVRHAVKDEEENYREFKNNLLNPKEGDCIFL